MQPTVLLFKTNISLLQEQLKLKILLDSLPFINRWTLDSEDADCVLKIVAGATLTAAAVMRSVQSLGFECSELD